MNHGRDKRYLCVDLARKSYETRDIEPEVAARYPSGIALATYLLHVLLPTGTDPLAAENVLVLAPGLFAGTPYPGATRVAVATKSPLTGLWAGGTTGGRFAWALAQTEWDAVVIQGKAHELSYLLIDEGRVFFRSASALRGYSCSATRGALQDKWGQPAATICIGPAGESQLGFATLEDGGLEAPIRGGLGAVFGSKNLKALVTRPYCPVAVARSSASLDAALPLIQNLGKIGSPGDAAPLGVLGTLARAHALPVRNFQGADGCVAWLASLASLGTYRRSCPGCPLACMELVVRRNDSQSPAGVFTLALNPEPLWALGPLLDHFDLDHTLAAIKASAEYGTDPVSLGIAAAWMAECHERRIELGLADLHPEFGTGSWLPGLPARITEDEHLGQLFAHGVSGAARKTDSGSQDFAMHDAGHEFTFVDPRRGFWPLSSLGPTVWLPLRQPGSTAFQGDQDEVSRLIHTENLWALFESVGICKWVALAQDSLYENLALFHELVSGADPSGPSLVGLGERCISLIRAFNHREGWCVEHTTLPRVFFDRDLTTPQGTYPALDVQAWQENARRHLAHREPHREESLVGACSEPRAGEE